MYYRVQFNQGSISQSTLKNHRDNPNSLQKTEARRRQIPTTATCNVTQRSTTLDTAHCVHKYSFIIVRQNLSTSTLDTVNNSVQQ